MQLAILVHRRPVGHVQFHVQHVVTVVARVGTPVLLLLLTLVGRGAVVPQCRGRPLFLQHVARQF